MLEYHKLILEKVSFDKQLFWKEYRKSCKKLSEKEALILKKWAIKRFALQGLIAEKIAQVPQ